MSTPQYGIRVVEIDGRKLTVEVLCTSKESPVPPDTRDVDFVRLLCEEESLVDNPKRKPSEPALQAQVQKDEGDLFDEEWLYEQAPKYITKVERLELVEGKAKYSSLDPRTRTWAAEKSLPRATFRLTLKAERFAAHLRQKDAWESTAYACESWADEEDEVAPTSSTASSASVRFDARLLEFAHVGDSRRSIYSVTMKVDGNRAKASAKEVRSLGKSALVQIAGIDGEYRAKIVKVDDEYVFIELPYPSVDDSKIDEINRALTKHEAWPSPRKTARIDLRPT